MLMSREFKFGDKVYCDAFGKGVVIGTEDNGDSFPIKVFFEYDDKDEHKRHPIEDFTIEGHYDLFNRDVIKNIRHMDW